MISFVALRSYNMQQVYNKYVIGFATKSKKNKTIYYAVVLTKKFRYAKLKLRYAFTKENNSIIKQSKLFTILSENNLNLDFSGLCLKIIGYTDGTESVKTFKDVKIGETAINYFMQSRYKFDKLFLNYGARNEFTVGSEWRKFMD